MLAYPFNLVKLVCRQNTVSTRTVWEFYVRNVLAIYELDIKNFRTVLGYEFSGILE